MLVASILQYVRGHVRADRFYRLRPPQVQASVELVLYLLFFFPAFTAHVISGWGYGTSSLRILEVSVNSPAGGPIRPLKMMSPIGASLLTLQGVAEVLRCVQCLRRGRWSPRLQDVEELENQILDQVQQTRAGGSGMAEGERRDRLRRAGGHRGRQAVRRGVHSRIIPRRDVRGLRRWTRDRQTSLVLPPAIELKDPALAIVIGIGVAMMLVDLYQSLRRKD